VSPVSLPSFPPTVPYPGAALCSAGSLGSVPPRRRSYCGTPTPRAPALLCSSLCFAVPALSGGREGSQVPGQPLCTRAGLRPRWRRQVRTPGCALRFDLLAVAWPRCPPRRPPQSCGFRGSIRRPRTRCLRFAAALTGGPRKTRFRLAVLCLGRSGLAPAVALRSFSRYIPSSSPRLFLAHGRSRGRGSFRCRSRLPGLGRRPVAAGLAFLGRHPGASVPELPSPAWTG
jgi:hypothetical protein